MIIGARRSEETLRGTLDERYSHALVGWLYCERCRDGGLPEVVLGGVATGLAARSSRPDVPGMEGFLIECETGGDVATLRCARHPRRQLRPAMPPLDRRALKHLETVTTADGFRIVWRKVSRSCACEHLDFVSGTKRQAWQLESLPDSYVCLRGQWRSIIPELMAQRADLELIDPCSGLAVGQLSWQDDQMARSATDLGGDATRVTRFLANAGHTAISSPRAPRVRALIADGSLATQLRVAAAVCPSSTGLHDVPLTSSEQRDLGRDSSLLEVVRHWPEWPYATVTDARDNLPAPPVDGSSQWTLDAWSGLVIVGMMRHDSALGWNARVCDELLAEALDGVADVPIEPEQVTLPSCLSLGSRDYVDLSGADCLVFWPLEQIPELVLRHGALHRAKRLIGFFMWELTSVPEGAQTSLALFDELWTASHYVAGVLRSAFAGPVRVVGHLVDVDNSIRNGAPRADNSFAVGFFFDAHSSLRRKNPEGAIRAWQSACPDANARFILKVRHWSHVHGLAAAGDQDARSLVEAVSQDARIHLITEELSHQAVLEALANLDCYISLHRAEGFGLTIAEAMALNVPVVTTAFSGNLDFCTDETAAMVRYDIKPVRPGDYFGGAHSTWAEPDLAHAAQHLIDVRARFPAERVCAARQLVSVSFSREAYMAKLVSALMAGRAAG